MPTIQEVHNELRSILNGAVNVDIRGRSVPVVPVDRLEMFQDDLLWRHGYGHATCGARHCDDGNCLTDDKRKNIGKALESLPGLITANFQDTPERTQVLNRIEALLRILDGSDSAYDQIALLLG